jgi:hypothetical protein
MNISDNKVSSIKCQYPPGGNANFSLNWSSQSSQDQRKTQRSTSRNRYNILTNEKENFEGMMNIKTYNDDDKKQAIKTNYDIGKSKVNLFNETKNSYLDKPSSIKVAHAPGGRSNIIFGDDTSSYEDYRRKK